MDGYINWNGKLVNKGSFCISPDNRSFRYGDGFFETMQANQLDVALKNLHFQRLFRSLELLQFDVPAFFTPTYFLEQIQLLLRQNQHLSFSRVRLMIYRGDGTVYNIDNNYPNFVIQSWPLSPSVNEFNSDGLIIGIYREAKKSCDSFSALKSNNYLSYLMGALYATKNTLNDAVILNHYDRIADTTIANIFIIKDEVIKTPPLSEGCVDGVYRKFLLQSFIKDSIPCIEEPLTITNLIEASEVFLTNAVTGIRWVQKCGPVTYKNELSAYLHSKYAV